MDTKDGRNQRSEEIGSTVREQLSRELALRAEGEAGQPAPETRGSPSVGDRFKRFFVKDREIMAFYQELALLLECGMPLVKSLHALEARWGGAAFRSIIADLVANVEQGRSFSQALERHPQYFAPTIVSMVRAGEASGHLGQMLTQVAERGEKLMSVRRSVITSLIYPCILLLVATFVVIFIFGVLADGFKQLLGDKAPPPSMEFLLKIGALFSSGAFWVIFLVAIVVLVCLYAIACRLAAFRFMRDSLKLHIPLVRHFVKQGLLTRFSIVFSTMLRAGVPLEECLTGASDTTNNEVLRRTIRRVQDAVRRGERISGELAKGGVFPSLAYDLCGVAEEAGALDRVFARMAVVYEEKQAQEMAMLGKILQPAIVLVMALIVGFVVFAFFSMYTSAWQSPVVGGG